MLISTKSGAPEKDRNASVSAAEVMGRVVPHDGLLHRLRHVDRRQDRM